MRTGGRPVIDRRLNNLMSATMMTFRLTRTLVAVTCLAVICSGCCVTSLKIRKSQPCPCENQTPYADPSDSGLMPIPSGAPPVYSSPQPAEPVPPAPASASTGHDLGVKTTAMFRSAGDRMRGAFDRFK